MDPNDLTLNGLVPINGLLVNQPIFGACAGYPGPTSVPAEPVEETPTMTLLAPVPRPEFKSVEEADAWCEAERQRVELCRDYLIKAQKTIIETTLVPRIDSFTRGIEAANVSLMGLQVAVERFPKIINAGDSISIVTTVSVTDS